MRPETKATAISPEVKRIVWERDGKQCTLCQKYVPVSCACAHVVRRSQGGMGVEENIVTLCPECHREADEGKTAHLFEVYRGTGYALHLDGRLVQANMTHTCAISLIGKICEERGWIRKY